MIRKPPITLIDLDIQAASLILADPARFERSCHVTFGDLKVTCREIADQTAIMLTRSPREKPWGAYWAVNAVARQVVGTCAFKNGPDAQGNVEIAYFTLPPFEGRGIGTAMAAALVDVARHAPTRPRVIAHTLPEENASTKILRKLEFTLEGTVQDPEDGAIWRWALK
ncbi:MAG: GNAT family N-acetyltransferase [Phycisphaerae bacterium]|nr:GNAT family N-acetyltransferase [Phycisphaerae bacterium]